MFFFGICSRQKAEVADGWDIDLGDAPATSGKSASDSKSPASPLLKDQPVVKSQSIDSELKSSAKGFNRFRWGYSVALSYQGAINVKKNPHPVKGFGVSGGVFLITNPIRNFLDFEFGADMLYIGAQGYDEKDSSIPPKAPEYGMYGARLYAAPIFRSSKERLSVAAGVFVDVALHGKTDGTEISVGGKKYKPASIDVSNSKGVYIDLQGSSIDRKDKSRLIGLLKLSYGTLESKYVDFEEETHKQKYWSLGIGVKF